MKFLVVRFSAIGDCVMAAHVPSRVRRHAPNAFIAWAVEDRCEDVVDANRLVDFRHSIARGRLRKQRWNPRAWREALAYYARLRSERFDVGLDLQGHLKTGICLRLARPKRRLAVKATDQLTKLLNPVMRPDPSARHVVEHALACLAQVLDADEDSSPIMPELSAYKERIFLEVPKDKPLVTIAVGAGQPDKAYPLERWQLVAENLIADGLAVAFLGGPESSAAKVPGSVDLVGKLTLAESMAAIEASCIHLAGDTGAGHIAGAYRVPGVSVFGPTDPAVFRPYSDTCLVLREGLDTSNVSADQVIEAAYCQLERYGRKLPN